MENKENEVMGVVRKIGNGEWRMEKVNRKKGEVKIDKEMMENEERGDMVEVEMI